MIIILTANVHHYDVKWCDSINNLIKINSSEPLRSKDGGPSKVSPNCAGWDRRDAIGDIASDASVSSAFRTWHFFWRMKNKK